VPILALIEIQIPNISLQSNRPLHPTKMRTSPNIIITGTPGVGKTTHCEQLVAQFPTLTQLSINQVVKDRGCHEGYDEEMKSYIVDEDKVSIYSLCYSYGVEVGQKERRLIRRNVAPRLHRRRGAEGRVLDRLACL
jgi:hypothetical protein